MSNINNIVLQNYNEGKICNALGQCWDAVKSNPGKTATTVGGAALGGYAGSKAYDNYKNKGVGGMVKDATGAVGNLQGKAKTASALIGAITAGLNAYNKSKSKK